MFLSYVPLIMRGCIALFFRLRANRARYSRVEVQ